MLSSKQDRSAKSRKVKKQDLTLVTKEAIAAYLESLAARDEPIPPPIAEEFVEVAI